MVSIFTSRLRDSRRALLLLIALLLSVAATAHAAETWDTSINNLLVVLRESPGANKLDESLKPMGKARAKLPDGKEVEVETGWFEYIGDMHIRFVFDAPKILPNATPKDLERLKLSPEEALRVAVANLKRMYGTPTASPSNDLMEVKGKAADLDSSYFLDREFWQALAKKHPEGLVVSVAKRGGLLYTPLSNTKAVERLSKDVAQLHASSGRLRISSALYLFKDDRWSVYQPAVKQ